MRSRTLPIVLASLIVALIAVGVIFLRNQPQTANTAIEETPAPQASELAAPTGSPAAEVSPAASGTPETKGSPTMTPDLSVNESGLSKATVVMETTQGTIKFKFYSKDAPNTVARIVELINKGFYNNLSFHRVVPGFVIQGGDPVGNGTGGSGTKLKAEFNNRPHVLGTVAMARAADPDSADSQFYISLGTHPHLDRNYTVFGQVVEGIDVAKKIKVGDKMTAVTIENQ